MFTIFFKKGWGGTDPFSVAKLKKNGKEKIEKNRQDIKNQTNYKIVQKEIIEKSLKQI